jgi:hypothetical protein
MNGGESQREAASTIASDAEGDTVNQTVLITSDPPCPKRPILSLLKENEQANHILVSGQPISKNSKKLGSSAQADRYNFAVLTDLRLLLVSGSPSELGAEAIPYDSVSEVTISQVGQLILTCRSRGKSATYRFFDNDTASVNDAVEYIQRMRNFYVNQSTYSPAPLNSVPQLNRGKKPPNASVLTAVSTEDDGRRKICIAGTVLVGIGALLPWVSGSVLGTDISISGFQVFQLGWTLPLIAASSLMVSDTRLGYLKTSDVRATIIPASLILLFILFFISQISVLGFGIGFYFSLLGASAILITGVPQYDEYIKPRLMDTTDE